ncbi:MAG: TetR/AcrR family transcriptional regulator [Betaproteobacteria bacterium]|nr:TetR/AcrR family transcriptional regulator [Betaproteobacteria bacterium]
MARPAGFDRDEVLEKAMNAFWEQGYGATGVAELGAITQLNPGSLYGAFESKQKLFMATLERYGTAGVERLQRALSSAPSPLEGIRSLFATVAADVAGVHADRGCLLVNTALEIARHEEPVRELIKRYFREIEGVLRLTLERAQAQGEISQDKDAGALAAFLILSIWGLRVLGATRPGHDQARLIVTQILSVLDGKGDVG